jgi:hypothetical protein
MLAVILAVALAAIGFAGYRFFAADGEKTHDSTSSTDVSQGSAGGRPNAPIKQRGPHRAPNVSVPVSPVGKQGSPPDFSGTWQWFEALRNGVSMPVSGSPMTLSQNGSVITRSDSGKQFQITSSGIATRQAFFATDGKRSREVDTAAQADVIQTVTLRMEGATLIREVSDLYKTRVGDHQPGTKMLDVDKFRRMTPGIATGLGSSKQ